MLTGRLWEVRRTYSRKVPWHGAVGGVDTISTEWRREERFHCSVHDLPTGVDVLPFQMCWRNQPGSSVDESRCTCCR